MISSPRAQDERAAGSVRLVRTGIVSGSIAVESDPASRERARDGVLDEVEPRHFQSVNAHVAADRLVRGDLPLVATRGKPKAAVFDAGLLQRHPDACVLVLVVRVPVGFVLVPRRGGAVPGRLEDGVGNVDAGLRPEQLLAHSLQHIEVLALVQLRRVLCGVQDLRQAGGLAVFICAREIELVTRFTPSPLLEHAVISLAHASNLGVVGDRGRDGHKAVEVEKENLLFGEPLHGLSWPICDVRARSKGRKNAFLVEVLSRDDRGSGSEDDHHPAEVFAELHEVLPAPRSRARPFHVAAVVPRCDPLTNRGGAVILPSVENRRTQDADDDASDEDLEDAFGVGIHAGEDTLVKVEFDAGPRAGRDSQSARRSR